MSADCPIEPQEFAEAFRRVSEWAMVEAQQGRSPFKAKLTEHFGEDPVTYPLTGEAMAVYEAEGVSPAFLRELVRKAAMHDGGAVERVDARDAWGEVERDEE